MGVDKSGIQYFRVDYNGRTSAKIRAKQPQTTPSLDIQGRLGIVYLPTQKICTELNTGGDVT